MVFKKDYTKNYQEHLERIWRNTGVEIHWKRGPLHELPESFKVLEFAPNDNRPMWTYATCGMSLDVKDGIELHLFTKTQDLSLVELLYAIAHYNLKAKLSLWHTVNFGRPWIAGSICEYGLISLPYLDGPDLENFEFNGKTIKCLWLIPISKAERDFKKTRGIEFLEERFEEANFDYADPFRKSVV